MEKFKTYISNIAWISPNSIGYFFIIGLWEPIYQLLRLFKLTGNEFSGLFIVSGFFIAVITFIFDYAKLKIRSKRVKK